MWFVLKETGVTLYTVESIFEVSSVNALWRTDLVIELTKKHILLVSFGIHAYGSGLKRVVFFGFGHNNPKATGCLDRLLVCWIQNTSEKVGARIGRWKRSGMILTVCITPPHFEQHWGLIPMRLWAISCQGSLEPSGLGKEKYSLNTSRALVLAADDKNP